MLYLDLSCVLMNKMCTKVSAKPNRARKGVVLSVKLDVIVSIVVNKIKTEYMP